MKNYPWSGKLGQITDFCLVCGSKDMYFQSGITCKDCHGKKLDSKLLAKHLDEYEKLARKWCQENGYIYDVEITRIMEA